MALNLIPTDPSRDAHLARCKHDALGYVDRGLVVTAICTMASSLGLHDGTRMDPKVLGPMIKEATRNPTPESVRQWIKGFG